MELLIHSKTSTIAPLKSENGYAISSYTLSGMWLSSLLELELNHVSKKAPESV